MSSHVDSLNVKEGTGISIAATGSSVSGTFSVPSNARSCLVVNTSATLYVAFRFGSSTPTAVLATDTPIPPMGMVVVDLPAGTTHAAAIGSGAGPTAVRFQPVFNA